MCFFLITDFLEKTPYIFFTRLHCISWHLLCSTAVEVPVTHIGVKFCSLKPCRLRSTGWKEQKSVLTSQVLYRERASAAGRGQGTFLADALLPVKSHPVTRRERQPTTAETKANRLQPHAFIEIKYLSIKELIILWLLFFCLLSSHSVFQPLTGLSIKGTYQTDSFKCRWLQLLRKKNKDMKTQWALKSKLLCI